MKQIIPVLLVLAIVPTLAAQQSQCSDPDKHPEQCTVGQAVDFFRDAALGVQITNTATKEVANSNRATTPPDAFAGRLHNSYQDFLNRLAFAINKVDESVDGQALTVRFNPIREGSQVLGLTLTTAKPVIAEVVKASLPETGRADLVNKLEEKVSDGDDLTIAASYALQSSSCDLATPATSRCYGRSPSSYRSLLSVALVPILTIPADEIDREIFETQRSLVRTVTRKNADGTFTELPAAFPESTVQQAERNKVSILTLKLTEATEPASLTQRLRLLGEDAARQTVANKSYFTKQNLDVIASLIDNQPQLAFTGSFHTPGKYGGARQTALSAELQFGAENVNSIRAECPVVSAPCIQAALRKRMENGISTDKWVMAATYTRDDNFRITDLGLGAANPPGFQPIDKRSSSELIVKGQGGRKMSAMVGSNAIRGDLSLEGHRIENDRVRTSNRWVAKGTLTIPLGENVSIPVTVSWANKSEFLGDQKRKFGAHLGLSYRLPFGGEK